MTNETTQQEQAAAVGESECSALLSAILFLRAALREQCDVLVDGSEDFDLPTHSKRAIKATDRFADGQPNFSYADMQKYAENMGLPTEFPL